MVSDVMLKRITTFGIKTTLAETRDIDALTSILAESANQSVFFCNVHMLMLAQEDSVLASAMDNADVVFADGVPVAWLQRRLTHEDAQVIRGYEVMLAICKRALETGEKIGFFGSTSEVMDNLVMNMNQRFKGLPVAYQSCPPYVQGELISSRDDLQSIRESGIKWLFVGLGCPKQEKWIVRYQNELDCHVLGVGAAFDWLSGTSKKPPEWMEKYALAWLYRLLNDPRKLWYRYLKYNTRFVFKATTVLWGHK